MHIEIGQSNNKQTRAGKGDNMTLIDRSELLKIIRNLKTVNGCSSWDCDEVEEAIINAPEIDTEEVVRCKNCKFSNICLMRHPNESCNEPYKDEDWCSYGKPITATNDVDRDVKDLQNFEYKID